MNKEELWQAVLAQIQLNISSANFATWFKNTNVSSIKGNKVVISVPNSFVKEWLEQKYNKLIFKILHTLNENIKEVKYEVVKSRSFNSSFNSYLTTQNIGQIDFVVGPFNELAHAAAEAVVKNLGVVYNPFFIYGGVGLGKTHLLQAVGNEVVKIYPKKKVKYLSSEKFTSEVEDFKIKYRNIDLLIIDDVQFLAGKEKTQEEFFHTFNTLYEANKQIVISSDRLPKAIPALTERLRSRFEGGMIVDIADLESKIAILKTKALEKNTDFPDEIYNYIASIIQKNIRELEGALNHLIAYQKTTQTVPTLETAKKLLKNFTYAPNKVVTPKKIIQTVAEFYDLKEKELLSKTRKKEIVKPRQVAMYLLRKLLSCSFPFIGRKFNGKDHTTAIYSFEKITKEIEKNENLKEEINQIKEKLLYL